MTFKIIDIKTGREPSSRVIYDVAKRGLIKKDIDQFAVCENGMIILMDHCGNIVACDPERFKVLIE